MRTHDEIMEQDTLMQKAYDSLLQELKNTSQRDEIFDLTKKLGEIAGYRKALMWVLK